MLHTCIQYPALVYKNNTSNVFVANCIIKKLVGFGTSEEAAVLNLEKILNKQNTEYPVKVKPVYRYLSDNFI